VLAGGGVGAEETAKSWGAMAEVQQIVALLNVSPFDYSISCTEFWFVRSLIISHKTQNNLPFSLV
jgi:hypothetical protein